MRLPALAGMAALIAASAGAAAQAQDPYGSEDNPNVRAYVESQQQRSVYDYQQDAYARARETYALRTADYLAERSAYEHRLGRYERARADYDARYGPGAYERYHRVPTPPY